MSKWNLIKQRIGKHLFGMFALQNCLNKMLLITGLSSVLERASLKAQETQEGLKLTVTNQPLVYSDNLIYWVE